MGAAPAGSCGGDAWLGDAGSPSSSLVGMSSELGQYKVLRATAGPWVQCAPALLGCHRNRSTPKPKVESPKSLQRALCTRWWCSRLAWRMALGFKDIAVTAPQRWVCGEQGHCLGQCWSRRGGWYRLRMQRRVTLALGHFYLSLLLACCE